MLSPALLDRPPVREDEIIGHLDEHAALDAIATLACALSAPAAGRDLEYRLVARARTCVARVADDGVRDWLEEQIAAKESTVSPAQPGELGALESEEDGEDFEDLILLLVRREDTASYPVALDPQEARVALRAELTDVRKRKEEDMELELEERDATLTETTSLSATDSQERASGSTPRQRKTVRKVRCTHCDKPVDARGRVSHERRCAKGEPAPAAAPPIAATPESVLAICRGALAALPGEARELVLKLLLVS